MVARIMLGVSYLETVEVIVVKGTLSDNDLASVNQYLTQKYKLP